MPLADEVGASWLGRTVGRRAPSGWEWNGSQSGQSATELGFPRPMLGKMQGEAACRAGDEPGPVSSNIRQHKSLRDLIEAIPEELMMEDLTGLGSR